MLKNLSSVREAHRTQMKLSKKIIMEDQLPKRIRYVAGVDVAYANDMSIAAIAVLTYDPLRLVESTTAFCKTTFPYIPTLLSFRELPPSLMVIKKLDVQPDVFLVDGHGYAHPYRCGLASHLGLKIGKPTIGVAKTRLIGEVNETKDDARIAYLKDKGEIIGAMVSTKLGSKPTYVSVGHMVSLKTAIKIVKKCVRESRIPEPLLSAHKIASAEKRKILARQLSHEE